MKFDTYTQEHGIEHILKDTEKIGAYCKLPDEQIQKLRLLTEEMLGLSVRLFDDLEYSFFIESENKGRRFTLNLSVKTLVDSSQRDKMLSLAESGKNKKGLLGKISGVFQSLVMQNNEYAPINAPYYDCTGMTAFFSLTEYKTSFDDEQSGQWDGLEKSIMATLADDIVIGVKSGRVEMLAVIVF